MAKKKKKEVSLKNILEIANSVLGISNDWYRELISTTQGQSMQIARINSQLADLDVKLQYLWHNNGNLYFLNYSKFGFGTDTPEYPFHVVGETMIEGKIHQRMKAEDRWPRFYESYCEDIGAGQCIQMHFGKGNTNYNCGYMRYHHLGDANNQNFIAFGAPGTSDLLTIRFDGCVGVGTTPDSNYKLNVGGSILFKDELMWSGGAIHFGPFQFDFGGTIKPYRGVFAILGADFKEDEWSQETFFMVNSQLGHFEDLNVDYNITTKKVNQTSDIRLKNNIVPITDFNLRTIADAPLVRYNWVKSGKEDIGTIAQYWESHYPAFVSSDKKGILSLDITKICLASSIVVAREVERLQEEMKAVKDVIVTLAPDLTMKLIENRN